MGSGTLVKVLGGHYVLTAAHVWECFAQPQVKSVGVSVGEVGEWDRTFISKDELHPWFTHRVSEEWGPDLAFIPVSPARAASFEARHKVFFNLQKTLDHDPQREYFQAFMLVGPPKTLETRTDLWIVPFMGYQAVQVLRDGWSYLDVDLYRMSPGFLTDLRGVSGAGLWRMRLNLEDGEVQHTPRFESAALYQHEPIEGADFQRIRCHGSQSLMKCFAERRPKQENVDAARP